VYDDMYILTNLSLTAFSDIQNLARKQGVSVKRKCGDWDSVGLFSPESAIYNGG